MSNNSLSEHEKSEIESIKEDLINSVSTEFDSAPSSPLHEKTLESFKFESRSAPPSPIFSPFLIGTLYPALEVFII